MNLSAPMPTQVLLRIDSGAGFVVGVVVLTLRDWLSPLYGVPTAMIVLMGLANLAYATYSGTLAVSAWLQRGPSRAAIEALATANLFWAGICCGLLVSSWNSAHHLGLLLVGLEALFVGALGLVEHRLLATSRNSHN